MTTVIAHRGRPGNDPEFGRYGENTMLAFELALMAGAEMMEYDVRRCGSGELVIFHDDTLLRTTGQPGSVADYAYKELLKFNAGYGERIPLLEKVLWKFGHRIVHNIELKETGLAKEVFELIKFHKCEERVIVSAFDVRDDPDGADGTATWDDLAIFPTAGVKIALLAGKEKIQKMGSEAFIMEAQKRKASMVNPSLAAANATLVNMAHHVGLEVYVWTVNKKTDMKRMVKIGVDGFFSDFPERAAWVVKALNNV